MSTQADTSHSSAFRVPTSLSGGSSVSSIGIDAATAGSTKLLKLTTEYLAQLSVVLARVPHDALGRAVDLLLEARAAGRRVYVMGNGGSAATASHLVCDLVKTAHVPGLPPLRAFALADCAPLLTAWANDLAYERALAEQVLALVERDDVVIAISASGNSPNIIAGLMAASTRGAHTIGFLGFDGGAARPLVEVAIHIQCHDYGLVEDTHAAIGHAITAAIRSTLQSAEWAPQDEVSSFVGARAC